MDTIEIKRDRTISSGLHLHGDLILNGIPMGVTLERDDMEIFPGSYIDRVHESNRFQRKVIMLNDANGRTAIEIHAGNSIKDTRD